MDLRPDATPEEFRAWLKARPPLFTKSIIIDGHCLDFANPELVEIDEDGKPLPLSEAENERRFALIQKRNREGLSADEEDELLHLQTQSAAFSASAFPRPALDGAPLDELERRLSQAPPTP